MSPRELVLEKAPGKGPASVSPQGATPSHGKHSGKAGGHVRLYRGLGGGDGLAHVSHIPATIDRLGGGGGDAHLSSTPETARPLGNKTGRNARFASAHGLGRKYKLGDTVAPARIKLFFRKRAYLIFLTIRR